MARLFVSLYIFIALSLVSLTAVLNAFFFPKAIGITEFERSLVHSVQLLTQSGKSIEQIRKELGIELQLVPKNSIDWPADLARRLSAGEVVELHSADSKQLYMQHTTDQLLELTLAKASASATSFFIYSVSFFILFGILLALWLWPLWRDLVVIRKGVSAIQDDGSLPAIAIAKSSVAAPIAQALNSMSTQVKNLLASQRELSGAVAHEFRTPLARLKFALAMMPNEQDGHEELQQDLAELERLVQEMLDFTSLQVAAPELSMSEIPLLSMTKALLEKLSLQQPAHLNVQVCGEECVVVADEYYLERALQNLVLNAFRYAQTQLRISVQAEQDCIVLIAEDDGVGIAEDMLERVFEPFFRADKGRNRKVGGAGLGLAIVSKIAAWHKGRCKAGNSSLGGASFRLTLPRRAT